MAGARVQALTARLEKGRRKTHEILSALGAEAWDGCLYPPVRTPGRCGPPAWTVRDLLAHFVSAEEALRLICQDTAVGGQGAPEGFDFDAFNAYEQDRFRQRTPPQLLEDVWQARQETLDWLGTLSEDDLDRVGRHPVLGQVSLETMITAIYAHQLLHMRELQAGRS
ncbi:MAG: DinB family protein [Chloroflexota bacterium]